MIILAYEISKDWENRIQVNIWGQLPKHYTSQASFTNYISFQILCVQLPPKICIKIASIVTSAKPHFQQKANLCVCVSKVTRYGIVLISSGNIFESAINP